MISSKALILKVITVFFFMGGCAPEDGGKKVKSVSFYLSNETDYSIQNVLFQPQEMMIGATTS